MVPDALNAPTTVPPSDDAEQMLLALDEAREHTLALVAHLDDEQLERVYTPLMSPLVWDLGHIAAYEDLWLVNRHADIPLLRPDLAELYDAFETPRAVRGEIETLEAAEARVYLREVRARTAGAIAQRGVGDGFVHEMVVRHELQHSETMRQTLAIAELLPAGEPNLRPLDGGEGWVEIPAGPFAMGAGEDGFAYDNERPCHTVEVDAFQIARRPVSEEDWARFVGDGGYRRREWWSREGWEWLRLQKDIAPPPAIVAGERAARPVCHVSWFEADAFARAHGARLPSEAEWEKAARQNALAAIGQVWEWTRTRFHGYPEFVAYPYREYSEVFFGEDYRVLRGSSWATHPRVANLAFRNWDLPQRRQLFAGVRLARDAA